LDVEPPGRHPSIGWGRNHPLIPFTSRYRCNEVSVANIKSQKKRNRTNAKAAERNKAVKSELKTRLKNARTSIGNPENTEDVRIAVKRIDMAAAKGIIHPNTAARRKSRLMKKVNAAG
jgi:small subunit ribosomal protein S20